MRFFHLTRTDLKKISQIKYLKTENSSPMRYQRAKTLEKHYQPSLVQIIYIFQFKCWYPPPWLGPWTKPKMVLLIGGILLEPSTAYYFKATLLFLRKTNPGVSPSNPWEAPFIRRGRGHPPPPPHMNSSFSGFCKSVEEKLLVNWIGFCTASYPPPSGTN